PRQALAPPAPSGSRHRLPLCVAGRRPNFAAGGAMDPKNKKREPPSNDPLTEKSEHPAGTAAGAAAAGAVGGAIGAAVAGPAGGAVGVAVGAVAGGALGKKLAERVNPAVEEAYWRENWRKRPYADDKLEYDHYRAAYRHGWESRMMHADRAWDEVEPD